MGTHPIFESDFDCLTESSEKMSDSAISDFMNITGCADHARAKFYIDSANGDIDAAVISFFESAGDEQPADTETNEPTGSLGQVTIDPPRQANKGPNEYYAGGAQSGMAVAAPPSNEPIDNDQFVKDVFKRAKESVGAKAHEEERERRTEERFIGSGYRLGGDGVSSAQVAGQSARPQPKDIKLVMWKEGFSVDGGPLRRYDDPANKQFLDEITQGKLPMELRALGTEVNVSMEDRRKDDYEENKPKEEFKAFIGSGNRLGAGPSDDAGASTSVPAPVASAVVVDESKPKTKLRLRLANGKQAVQEFNQDHTIADLKSFCALAAPGKSFELRAGFPPKPITADDGQSLMDAKLLNETVIQRLL